MCKRIGCEAHEGAEQTIKSKGFKKFESKHTYLNCTHGTASCQKSFDILFSQNSFTLIQFATITVLWGKGICKSNECQRHRISAELPIVYIILPFAHIKAAYSATFIKTD